MADPKKTIEVMVAGAQTRRHEGDALGVAENGTLRISLGQELVAVYPQGQWIRAWKEGNLLEK